MVILALTKANCPCSFQEVKSDSGDLKWLYKLLYCLFNVNLLFVGIVIVEKISLM